MREGENNPNQGSCQEADPQGILCEPCENISYWGCELRFHNWSLTRIQQAEERSEELIVLFSSTIHTISFHITNRNYFPSKRVYFMSLVIWVSLHFIFRQYSSSRDSIKYFSSTKINILHYGGIKKIFTGPKCHVIMATQQWQLFCEIPRSYRVVSPGIHVHLRCRLLCMSLSIVMWGRLVAKQSKYFLLFRMSINTSKINLILQTSRVWLPFDILMMISSPG